MTLPKNKRIAGNSTIYDAEIEMKAYDVDFYNASRKDFIKALPVLRNWFLNHFNDQSSIIDLGCGSGEMIACIKNDFEVFGVDFSVGAQIEGPKFLGDNFISGDLTTNLRKNHAHLNRDFNVVVSLETYEHIHQQHEQDYLNNIASFNPNWIVISCALPEQKGRHHYNKLPFKTFIDRMLNQFTEFEGEFCSTITFHSLPYLRYYYRYNTIVLKRKM